MSQWIESPRQWAPCPVPRTMALNPSSTRDQVTESNQRQAASEQIQALANLSLAPLYQTERERSKLLQSLAWPASPAFPLSQPQPPNHFFSGCLYTHGAGVMLHFVQTRAHCVFHSHEQPLFKGVTSQLREYVPPFQTPPQGPSVRPSIRILPAIHPQPQSVPVSLKPVPSPWEFTDPVKWQSVSNKWKDLSPQPQWVMLACSRVGGWGGGNVGTQAREK